MRKFNVQYFYRDVSKRSVPVPVFIDLYKTYQQVRIFHRLLLHFFPHKIHFAENQRIMSRQMNAILLSILINIVFLPVLTKAAFPSLNDLLTFNAFTEDIPKDVNVELGGRTAIVHFPALPKKGFWWSQGKVKLPLVINLHALGSNAPLQELYTDFDYLANSKKFMVVYPNGEANAVLPTKKEGLFQPFTKNFAGFLNGFSEDLMIFKSWNAGGCCASASGKIDDIGYLRNLVNYIKHDMSQYNFELDMEKIYVTGMSNGGFMAHRVACEMSDIIAAAAPVAGPLSNTKVSSEGYPRDSDPFECNPERPVPILHIHSKNDPAVPFEGSKEFDFPSVSSTIETWKRINNVEDATAQITYNDKGSTDLLTSPTQCTPAFAPGTSSTVELCVIDSKGHCWPGKNPGQCQSNIGNEYIWEFFEKYKLD